MKEIYSYLIYKMTMRLCLESTHHVKAIVINSWWKVGVGRWPRKRAKANDMWDEMTWGSVTTV
jgi:hypothetical protein